MDDKKDSSLSWTPIGALINWWNRDPVQTQVQLMQYQIKRKQYIDSTINKKYTDLAQATRETISRSEFEYFKASGGGFGLPADHNLNYNNQVKQWAQTRKLLIGKRELEEVALRNVLETQYDREHGDAKLLSFSLS